MLAFLNRSNLFLLISVLVLSTACLAAGPLNASEPVEPPDPWTQTVYSPRYMEITAHDYGPQYIPFSLVRRLFSKCHSDFFLGVAVCLQFFGERIKRADSLHRVTMSIAMATMTARCRDTICSCVSRREAGLSSGCLAARLWMSHCHGLKTGGHLNLCQRQISKPLTGVGPLSLSGLQADR